MEKKVPTAYISKLAKEGHGSVESLEKKWNEAQKRAADEGKAKDYAYITGIFKHMIGACVDFNSDQTDPAVSWASTETADGINDVSAPVMTDTTNPADRAADMQFSSSETASPVKPGSPREVAAKNKTAALATKMLASHLRQCKTLMVKDLHVTHSWAPKPAGSYADPHFAYTALIPARAFVVTLADQAAVAKDIKTLYKSIGPVRVHGTKQGMLVTVPFNTGLAHTELMEDLYS